MKQNFEKLIQDFCKLCDIADHRAVLNGAPVAVDEVNFSITYNEIAAPDRVCVFGDFGAVPAGQKLKVYQALLESNLYSYENDTAVFTLSPESGHVICASRFLLQPLSAEELRGVVTLMSQKAKEWRAHSFEGHRAPGTAVRRGSDQAASLPATRT
jgi:hypothetical protein